MEKTGLEFSLEANKKTNFDEIKERQPCKKVKKRKLPSNNALKTKGLPARA